MKLKILITHISLLFCFVAKAQSNYEYIKTYKLAIDSVFNIVSKDYYNEFNTAIRNLASKSDVKIDTLNKNRIYVENNYAIAYYFFKEKIIPNDDAVILFYYNNPFLINYRIVPENYSFNFPELSSPDASVLRKAARDYKKRGRPNRKTSMELLMQIGSFYSIADSFLAKMNFADPMHLGFATKLKFIKERLSVSKHVVKKTNRSFLDLLRSYLVYFNTEMSETTTTNLLVNSEALVRHLNFFCDFLQRHTYSVERIASSTRPHSFSYQAVAGDFLFGTGEQSDGIFDWLFGNTVDKTINLYTDTVFGKIPLPGLFKAQYCTPFTKTNELRGIPNYVSKTTVNLPQAKFHFNLKSQLTAYFNIEQDVDLRILQTLDNDVDVGFWQRRPFKLIFIATERK